MLSRLLPRETSFFDFFDKHAALTIEGTREFLAVAEGTRPLGPGAKRIKEIEHETDVITHQCVEALHKTFITPIDRDEIHRLITRMDDIMDYMEAASERLALYELNPVRPELRELGLVLVRACEAVSEALGGLRDMKHAPAVLAKCIEINRLENEADACLRAAVAKLFKEEKDPITVIKWKEIYEALEEATDRCEDVANIIEGVILEHA
jgi:predicted phosphate transport protein (TIGR00153 family)